MRCDLREMYLGVLANRTWHHRAVQKLAKKSLLC
jgi:hypothetical protein